MPRYYFDVHDGFDLRDDLGQDLEDIEAVRRQALDIVSRLIAAEGYDDGRIIVVDARDASGAVALTVRMVSQVEVPPMKPAPGESVGTAGA